MLNENMGYDISKFVYLFFCSGFYTASLSGETIGCFRRGSAYNGCLSAAAFCYFIQGVSRLYIGVDAVDVVARVSGYLRESRPEAGTLVKQGELLYVIEPTLYEKP